MSIKDMVSAAQNGKVTDFEAAFNQAMAGKVLDTVQDVRHEVGSSVPVDGEITNEPDE
jgi:hypothetical protein